MSITHNEYFKIHDNIDNLIQVLSGLNMNVEYIKESGKTLSNKVIQSFVGSTDKPLEVNLQEPKDGLNNYETYVKNVTLLNGSFPVTIKFPNNSYIVLDNSKITLKLIWNVFDQLWKPTENVPIIPQLTEPLVLPVSNGTNGNYSCSLSASLRVLVIGNSEYNNNTGIVWIFERENIYSDWLSGTCIMCEGDFEMDKFGHSVSVSDTGLVIAIGAPGYNNGSGDGRVYIFRKIDGSWVGPEFAYDGLSGEQAGFSVNLGNNGNKIVIGSPLTVGGGKVTTLVYESNSWTNQSVLPVPTNSTNFGYSIAMSNDGTQVICGDPIASPGIVSVFTENIYPPNSGIWNQSWLASGYGGFGSSVSIVENNVYVTNAPNTGFAGGTGTVEIYGATGIHIQTLNGDSQSKNFGQSFGLSANGNLLVVGEDNWGTTSNGKITLYSQNVFGGSYTPVESITGADGEKLGNCVDIDNGIMVSTVPTVSSIPIVQLYQ